MNALGWPVKAARALRLFAYFVWEIILANLRVAVCVVGPLSRLKPGIVAVPLDARTDTEITLFANMITLTPGTLSVDISDDRSKLYVHTLFLEDPEGVKRELKQSFERPLLEILR